MPVAWTGRTGRRPGGGAVRVRPRSARCPVPGGPQARQHHRGHDRGQPDQQDGQGAPRSRQCWPASWPRNTTMPTAPIPSGTFRRSAPGHDQPDGQAKPEPQPPVPRPGPPASRTSGPDSRTSDPRASEVRRGPTSPRRPSSSQASPRTRKPYPSTCSHGHPSSSPAAAMVATTAANSATCCSTRRSSRQPAGQDQRPARDPQRRVVEGVVAAAAQQHRQQARERRHRRQPQHAGQPRQHPAPVLPQPPPGRQQHRRDPRQHRHPPPVPELGPRLRSEHEPGHQRQPPPRYPSTSTATARRPPPARARVPSRARMASPCSREITPASTQCSTRRPSSSTFTASSAVARSRRAVRVKRPWFPGP